MSDYEPNEHDRKAALEHAERIGEATVRFMFRTSPSVPTNLDISEFIAASVEAAILAEMCYRGEVRREPNVVPCTEEDEAWLAGEIPSHLLP